MNKWVVGVVVLLIIATISISYLLSQSAKTVEIEISGVTLSVELAETPADQQKGLSRRDSLAANHGMLFVFGREAAWSFWMKDMKFALDIIWFNSSRQAVSIRQNLQPCSPKDCPVFTPPAKATYVLEVNAGFVQAHNISLGTAFLFLG